MSANAKGGGKREQVPRDALEKVYEAVEQKLFPEEHCDSISQISYGHKLKEKEKEEEEVMFNLSKSHKSSNRVAISDMSEMEVEHNIQLLKNKLKYAKSLRLPSFNKKRAIEDLGDPSWLFLEQRELWLLLVIKKKAKRKKQEEAKRKEEEEEEAKRKEEEEEEAKLKTTEAERETEEEELDSDSDDSDSDDSDSDDSDSDSSSDSDSD